jgi:hypothetical protein
MPARIPSRTVLTRIVASEIDCLKPPCARLLHRSNSAAGLRALPIPLFQKEKSRFLTAT